MRQAPDAPSTRRALLLCAALLLLAAAAPTARAQEPSAAHNLFLDGLWLPADPIGLAEPVLHHRSLPLSYASNLSMTRTDRFALHFVGAEVVEDNLVVRYEGSYDHRHHLVRPVESWWAYDILGLFNHELHLFDYISCPAFALGFPLQATQHFALDPATGRWTGHVQASLYGTSPVTTLPYSHGTGIGLHNATSYFYGTELIEESWPLFSDMRGDVVRLAGRFGTPWLEGETPPTGCMHLTEANRGPVDLNTGARDAWFDFEWRRSPVAPLELRGELRGRVVSGSLTARRGTVEIHRQFGSLPARAPDETLAAWLETHAALLEPVGHTAIAHDGTFAFEQLPVFDADAHTMRSAVYALLVRDAEIEPVEGQAPLPLRSEIFAQQWVHLDEAPLETYTLEATEVAAIKRALIERINKLGQTHLAPIEAPLLTHVDAILSGDVELTDVRAEALMRSAWAERIVLEATQQADLALQVVSQRLGKLVVGLIDTFVSLRHEEIKKGEAHIAKLEAAREGHTRAQLAAFNAASVDELMRDKLHMREVRSYHRSQAAARAKGALTSLFAGSDALISLLGDTETFKKVRAWLAFIVGRALELAVTEHGGSAALSVAKLLVEQMIAWSHPVLLDNRLDPKKAPPGIELVYPVESLPSFTSTIAPYLQRSVDQTLSWPVANERDYLEDAHIAAGLLTFLIESGTQMQRLQIDLGAVADSSDQIGNAIAYLAAAGYKPAAIGEKLLKAGMLSANFAATAQALTYVFSTLPAQVDRGVAAAWRLGPLDSQHHDPTLPGWSGEAYDERVGERVAAAVADYRAACDALTSALRRDDLDAAAALVLDPAGAYLTALEEVRRVTPRAALLAAAAAIGTGSSLDPSLAMMHFEVRASRVYLELEALFVDVLVGALESPTEPAWIERRDTLVLMLAGLAQQLEATLVVAEPLTRYAYYPPMVLVESLTVASLETGSDLVTRPGEPFSVTARVATLGTHDVTDISAHLVLSGTHGETLATFDAPIGLLAADDGVAGSGDDERELTWQVTLPDSGGAYTLGVELREAGAAPTSWQAWPASVPLVPDPLRLDADLDEMQDAWELAHGLDTSLDDSADDADLDGLGNRHEHDRQTLPGTPDSDGDGLDDRDEVLGLTHGAPTDPLAPDSDGDGIDDVLDGAPLDFTRSEAVGEPAGEPAVTVSHQSVTLSRESPLVTVEIGNSGAGTLAWVARAEHGALVTLGSGSPAGVETPLTIAALTVDFASFSRARTQVFVIDVSGAQPDMTVVDVELLGEAPASEPPDVADEGAGDVLEGDAGETDDADDADADARPGVDDVLEPWGAGGGGGGCCSAVRGASGVPGAPVAWSAGLALLLTCWRRRRRAPRSNPRGHR